MHCELYCAAEYALTMVRNQDVEIDPKLRIKSVPGRGVMHDRRSASDAKEQGLCAQNLGLASFDELCGDKASKDCSLDSATRHSCFRF